LFAFCSGLGWEAGTCPVLPCATEEKLGFHSFSFTHSYIRGCPTKGKKPPDLTGRVAFAGGGESLL